MTPVASCPTAHHNPPPAVYHQTRGDKVKQIVMLPVGTLLSCGVTQVVALVALPIIGSRALHFKIKEHVCSSKLIKMAKPFDHVNLENAISTSGDKHWLELAYKILESKEKLLTLPSNAIACGFALIPLAGMHASVNYMTHHKRSYDQFRRTYDLMQQITQQIYKIDHSANDQIDLEEITL